MQSALDVIEELRPLETRVALPPAPFEHGPFDELDDCILGRVGELLGPSPAGRLERHAGGKVSLRPTA